MCLSRTCWLVSLWATTIGSISCKSKRLVTVSCAVWALITKQVTICVNFKFEIFVV